MTRYTERHGNMTKQQQCSKQCLLHTNDSFKHFLNEVNSFICINIVFNVFLWMYASKLYTFRYGRAGQHIYDFICESIWINYNEFLANELQINDDNKNSNLQRMNTKIWTLTSSLQRLWGLMIKFKFVFLIAFVIFWFILFQSIRCEGRAFKSYL